jgi:hypothetical protein
MSDKPLTISDIQFRCGLSYNTVKRTVFHNNQVKKLGGYPATFSVAKPEAMRDDIMWARYDRPDEGWITWLDRIRPLLVSITAMSGDMSAAEIAQKASMFASLGQSFLSLSKELETIGDKPDWVERLEQTNAEA